MYPRISCNDLQNAHTWKTFIHCVPIYRSTCPHPQYLAPLPLPMDNNLNIIKPCAFFRVDSEKKTMDAPT